MMTTRNDLAAAVRSAFEITRHEMSEEPVGRAQEIAFVALPGADRLKVARWHEGEGKTDRLKSFSKTAYAWFSVEPRHG